MKKLATLLLAAGLVFGAATGASAIDFKAKGQWIMNFDYGFGDNFVKKDRNGTKTVGSGYKKQDDFNASQRVRLQLDAVASESLSGTVFFEIGEQQWGNADQGGALGADGKMVRVKHAYIDWIVPNTDLKVRMGLQGLALPAFTTGASQIFDDDVAAIVLSNKFNDNVTLTAFWARPFNDNSPAWDRNNTGNTVAANYMDNMDMFGLLLPLSFDGVKVTPWAMISSIGPNVANNGLGYRNYEKDAVGNVVLNAKGRPVLTDAAALGNAMDRVRNGMLPAVWANKDGRSARLTQYGTAFFAGITGEVTMMDPFRLAWDVNYGGVDYGKQQYNRAGWYASLLGEYKMDWATPGLYAWYSSGDDSNVKNGSERMATISANGSNQFSNFAGNGSPYIAREGVLGTTLVGTWGIGARLKDISFLEGLKHTFRVNYFQGTNNPTMAKYISGKKDAPIDRSLEGNVADFNENNGLYLTTQDSALEFGLSNDYKIYDNLTLFVDANYIALWLDQSSSVWGNGYGKRANSTTDAFNVNVSFVYDF